MLGPINIKGKAPNRYFTPFAKSSLLVAILKMNLNAISSLIGYKINFEIRIGSTNVF